LHTRKEKSAKHRVSILLGGKTSDFYTCPKFSISLVSLFVAVATLNACCMRGNQIWA